MNKAIYLLKEQAKKAEDTYYMFDRDANKATTPAEKKKLLDVETIGMQGMRQ